MERVYVPKLCQEQVELKDGVEVTVPAEWSGEVTVRVPTVSEYLDIMSKSSKASKAIKAEGLSEQEQTIASLVGIKDLIPLAAKHVVKLNLTYQGKKYESFESLEEDMDALAMVIELATAVCSGFKVEGK